MVKLICIDGTIECTELMKKCFELIRNITTDIKDTGDGIPLSGMKITCDEMKEIINMYTTGELVYTERIRELLEYLGSVIKFNNDTEQKSVIEQLIDNDDIELLKCCVENGLPIKELHKEIRVPRYTQSDCQHNYENPYKEITLYFGAYGIAVNNGKINVLKYLNDININLNGDDLIYNAYIGNTRGLKFMLDNNTTCYINLNRNNNNCVSLDDNLIRSLCIFEYAILYNNEECKALIHSRYGNIYASNCDLVKYAAYLGNMEMLKRMLERADEGEFYIGESACDGAAYGGQLECLKWLHENRYAWADTVFSNAIKRGHEIDMMTYEEKSKLEETVNINGCIAYAYDHDCPKYEYINKSCGYCYGYDELHYEDSGDNQKICAKCKEIKSNNSLINNLGREINKLRYQGNNIWESIGELEQIHKEIKRKMSTDHKDCYW